MLLAKLGILGLAPAQGSGYFHRGPGGAVANPLCQVGDLMIGWLLLRQAEIALNALDGDPDPRERAFYSGKVAVANFFIRNVLPRLAAERRIVEAVDLAIMDLSEDAF